jgi:hypothetical protein
MMKGRVRFASRLLLLLRSLFDSIQFNHRRRVINMIETYICVYYSPARQISIKAVNDRPNSTRDKQKNKQKRQDAPPS